MVQFERFTERAQEAAQRATKIIRRYGHNQIDTEHILLALLEQFDGTIPQILEILNISAQTIIESLDRTLRIAPKANLFGGEAGQIFITPRVKRIIDLANDEANHFEDEQISTEHIFLAILSEQGTPAARALKRAGLTREQVYDAIQQIRNQMNLQEKDREKKESYVKSIARTSSKKSILAVKQTFNRVINNIKYRLEERQSLQTFKEVEGLMPIVGIIIAGVLAYLGILNSDIWLALIGVILVPGIILVSLLFSAFRKCNRKIEIEIVDIIISDNSTFHPSETRTSIEDGYVETSFFGQKRRSFFPGSKDLTKSQINFLRSIGKNVESTFRFVKYQSDPEYLVNIDANITVRAKLECPKCYHVLNITYPVHEDVTSYQHMSESDYKVFIKEDFKNQIRPNPSMKKKIPPSKCPECGREHPILLRERLEETFSRAFYILGALIGCALLILPCYWLYTLITTKSFLFPNFVGITSLIDILITLPVVLWVLLYWIPEDGNI